MNIKEVVAVRKANEIKQYEFAELMGIPVGTWSNVEAERHPFYSQARAKAVQILHELNCDFSILKDKEAMENLPQHVGKRRPYTYRNREDVLKKPIPVQEERKPAVKVGESNNIDLKSIKQMVTESIATVQGVGKDEPATFNEKGGGQSQVHYRLDLLDPKALFATAKVLKEGADKYGAENWRLIDIDDHLNHLLIHAYAYLAGDTSDEHLSHIVCRALFALGVELQTEKDIQRLNQQGE